MSRATRQISTARAVRNRAIRRVFALGLLLAGLPGCDESLPPRNDPPKVLSTSISLYMGNTVIVRDSIPVGTLGAFELQVRNVYDEVLEDSERVDMELEVWLEDIPSERAIIRATWADLTKDWILQAPLLRLGVDSTAVIRKQWSHRTADGTPFWKLIPLQPALSPGGEFFCGSEPVRFVARAKIQLFKHVQAITLPDFEFTIVYQVFGISCGGGPTKI